MRYASLAVKVIVYSIYNFRTSLRNLAEQSKVRRRSVSRSRTDESSKEESHLKEQK